MLPNAFFAFFRFLLCGSDQSKQRLLVTVAAIEEERQRLDTIAGKLEGLWQGSEALGGRRDGLREQYEQLVRFEARGHTKHHSKRA